MPLHFIKKKSICFSVLQKVLRVSKVKMVFGCALFKDILLRKMLGPCFFSAHQTAAKYKV